MEINDALVDKLAILSRLRFNKEEKEAIKNDLGKMIGFVEKLNELDTKGITPFHHLSENSNVFREDIVEGMCTRAEALQNASKQDGIFFKVPKVISKQ